MLLIFIMSWRKIQQVIRNKHLEDEFVGARIILNRHEGSRSGYRGYVIRLFEANNIIVAEIRVNLGGDMVQMIVPTTHFFLEYPGRYPALPTMKPKKKGGGTIMGRAPRWAVFVFWLCVAIIICNLTAAFVGHITPITQFVVSLFPHH